MSDDENRFQLVSMGNQLHAALGNGRVCSARGVLRGGAPLPGLPSTGQTARLPALLEAGNTAGASRSHHPPSVATTRGLGSALQAGVLGPRPTLRGGAPINRQIDSNAGPGLRHSVWFPHISNLLVDGESIIKDSCWKRRRWLLNTREFIQGSGGRFCQRSRVFVSTRL